MTAITSAENLQQYKGRFSLIEELIRLSIQALIWLEKRKICLQISSKLRQDVSHY